MMFDGLYRAEKPGVAGLELSSRRLVDLMGADRLRLIMETYMNAFQPDSGLDQGSDWGPLRAIMEFSLEAADRSGDLDLRDLVKRLGVDLNGSIGEQLKQAGDLPFNLDTLQQVNPELMTFFNLVWYQAIIQFGSSDSFSLSLEWWQARTSTLCGRGSEAACRSRESIEVLKNHVSNLKANGAVLRSYDDFNQWMPGDPDGGNFQELYDGLFGRAGAVDSAWMGVMITTLKSQSISEKNPDLERLYQGAQRSATAKFLNRDDLAQDRDALNEKIKVFQSQLSEKDGNAASTLTSIRDQRRKGMSQIWNDQWNAAIADAAANGTCADGVDCSLDALTAYVGQRGAPPVPDMTLIGTEAAKKLLQ